MIVNTVKYLIVGAKEDLDYFFEQAQERGFLEFISVAGKKPVELPVTVQSLLSAIKILRRQPLRDPYLGGGDLSLAMQVAERVLDLKEDLEKLSEEKRLLEAEISRVAPLGDFSLDDIAYIEKMGRRKIQFFCMKAAKSHKTNFPDDVIYLGTEYDLDYFLTISANIIAPPEMIAMRVDSPLGELENRLSFVVDAIHRFEAELKEYAGHIEFLQAILVEEFNKHHLVCAKKEVAYPLQNALFAVEAWVPENKSHTLFSFIDGMAIHAEEIVIEEADKVPTCIENRGLGLAGEDIVKIYDIPATSDKDPSLWVLWFFALFFAIIVADAGYGVILLGLTFYLKYKFPHARGAGKRVIKLSFILSTGCIIWGALTSAWFGLKIEPGSVWSKISALHYLAERKAEYHIAMKDDVYMTWVGKCPGLETAATPQEFLHEAVVIKRTTPCYVMLEEFSTNILMETMLVIAIIHMSLGFLRYLWRNIAGLGWIAFMIGGYFYFPSVLHATTMANFLGWVSKPLATAIGIQLLYGGIGFALLAALIQKRLKGIGEIANIVQVFADSLSYLRLYALGLAGSIMAATFNIEGADLGLVAGGVVIFSGHVLTISLALMGGVIHGLRLNFIEWYHYCFDGGGRLLRPLHKLKVK